MLIDIGVVCLMRVLIAHFALCICGCDRAVSGGRPEDEQDRRLVAVVHGDMLEQAVEEHASCVASK